VVATAVVVAFLSGQAARAQLAIASQFDPSGIGSICGLGYDAGTGGLWVHGCFGADVQRYSTSGVFQSAVARPGESANDVDVEVSAGAFTLGATVVPKYSLLYVNGESGVAEVYALDKTTGSVVSSLVTAFGASHVVGGAYHRSRQTLFLVQDQVAAAADRNRIAEIDPQTGAVVGTFQIGATFSVNFGDVEVCNATGNLLVVSSDENRIAEYTPAGALVQYHPLPTGVSSLAGIGIDDATGELWVASSSTAGQVWRLSGGPCGATPVPALSGSAPVALAGLLVAAGFFAIARVSRRGARSDRSAPLP